MLETWIPFSKTDPFDFGETIRWYFRKSETHLQTVRPQAWPALKVLSELGLDNISNMMTFLPTPEDPDFPLQVFGLQLVLDQTPRVLCKGVDGHYIYAYFGEIALKVAQ